MRYQPFIIIAALAVIVYYLLTKAGDDTILITDSTSPLLQDYDYFMTNINNQHLGPEGAIQYHLLADRLTHYPEPDVSLIDTPDITIFQESSSPWHITADNGRLSADIELTLDRLELSNNVVIHSVDENGLARDIYTEYLLLYPSTKYMSTDREVLVISTGSEITSMGMTADLNIDEIHLLANVRARYE